MDAGAELRETADRVLAGLPAGLSEGGGFSAAAWGEIEAAGLTTALLPEAAGGFGVAPSDALSLLVVAGRHGLALPLAETMLAGWVLAQAGIAVPGGVLTVAELAEVSVGEGSARGVAWDVAWGREAGHLVVLAEGRVALVSVAGCSVEVGVNIAGDSRDTLRFDGVAVTGECAVTGDGLRAAGAATRALLIAGALEAVLATTVRYAGERVQFGKPIGRFQAVQQQLAVLAGQVAAAGAAAGLAAERFGEVLPGAAAKVRAGEAAGLGAAIAHQVHGAIGFTEEHHLHRLTRRLWAWRDEWGNEAVWSRILGRHLAAAGPERLWGELAAL